MSRKSLRNIERIDYKIYSETGKKVAKERRELIRIERGFENLSKMSVDKLIDEETKVRYKFQRFLLEYQFDILFDIEDIEKGILEIKTIIESFEGIHIELNRELDTKYLEKYPDFSEMLTNMTDWVKNAKLEINKMKVSRAETLRREKKENEEKKYDQKADQLRKEREMREVAENKERENLKIALKHLNTRTNLDLTSIEQENSIFITDMERNIGHVRHLIKEHSELYAQIEIVFGGDFQKEFSEVYEAENDRMFKFLCDIMKECQQAKHNENKRKEESDKNKASREAITFSRENAEKIDNFNGIFSNIKERILLFRSKCEIDLSHLSDSDILKKVDVFKNLDNEFSRILDWATELIKTTPYKNEKSGVCLKSS